MTTARGLIEHALQTAGVVSPMESVTSTEATHGLHELNPMLDVWNNEHQWPYTSITKNWTVNPTGQSDYSIGVGDGRKISVIQSIGPMEWGVTTIHPHGLNVGAIIQIVDTLNFNVTNQTVTAVTPTTFELSNMAITPTLESVGYVYLMSENVPNIITPRPMDILDIGIIKGELKAVLNQLEINDYEEQNRVTLSGEPYTFAYQSSYPFGTIKFGTKVDSNYQLDIRYRSDLTTYAFDDVINLPPGYEAAIQYGLAVVLGLQYKVDVSAISILALRYKTQIKRQNYKPNRLSSDFPSNNTTYNIYNDRWGV